MAIVRASASRDPRVLADLEADSHTREIEEHVTERVTLPAALELHHLMIRPWFEPARFIVKPLTCEVLLSGEARDVAIGDDARGVVQTTPTSNRHPDAHDHALGLGYELRQHRPRAPGDIRSEERVFTAVPRRAELGEHEQRHPLGARLPNHCLDAPLVAGPIERRLIQ